MNSSNFTFIAEIGKQQIPQTTSPTNITRIVSDELPSEHMLAFNRITTHGRLITQTFNDSVGAVPRRVRSCHKFRTTEHTIREEQIDGTRFRV